MKHVVIDIGKIRKSLGHNAAEEKPRLWLDTGQVDLHRVLGSEIKGIPYGKIIEISGNESNGKTALALEICKYAQEDEAYIIWADFENSYDPIWFRRRGLRLKRQFTLIQEYLMQKAPEKKEDEDAPPKKEKKKKLPDIASCSELVAEINATVKAAAKHYKKIVVVVDSIAAMETQKEAEAKEGGLDVYSELSRFLSKTLKRFSKLSRVYSVLYLCLNQLRTKPMAFGDPEYTVGGKAMPFYAAVRARVRLVKGGRIVQGSKTIGTKGYIYNFKNKCGGGSIPHEQAGFKIYFDKPAKFMSFKEIKKESKNVG